MQTSFYAEGHMVDRKATPSKMLHPNGLSYIQSCSSLAFSLDTGSRTLGVEKFDHGLNSLT